MMRMRKERKMVLDTVIIIITIEILPIIQCMISFFHMML